MNQIVSNGRTGLVVAERDSQGLAAAAIALASDRSLAASIGAAAAQEVRLNYDIEKTSKRMEELYRTVLGNRLAGAEGPRRGL
jgi:glycosyltransferase involved in cell wall biosynthesis